MVRVCIHEDDGDCSSPGSWRLNRGMCPKHRGRYGTAGAPPSQRPYAKLSTEERFWVRVDKTETCWNWTGRLTPSGYGEFAAGAGQSKRAHVYSYRLHKGEVPEGKMVLHSCKGNRRCVNPDHLRAGTPQGNMDDREKDGNVPRGNQHHATKIRDEDLPRLRELREGGMSLRALGREFGVTHRAIHQALLTRGT
jgi:hypothetical protein